MKKLYFEDWGMVDYDEALTRQRNLFEEALCAKSALLSINNRWIFCEHPPVITMGKHGKKTNLLLTEDLLEQHGIAYFETERGGDVTFHGPGQIVAYPILDLESLGIGLRQYIEYLEEIVIRTLADYGLKGERVAGASGVWLGKGTKDERKICAIGVKSSRFVTMHGFALNINTDLSYFSFIHPCGFTEKGVTSLQQELKKTISLESIKERLKYYAMGLL